MKRTEHIIINVGRQIGSGGHIVAKQLAEYFGCCFYDREILNLAAKESGFCKEFFEENDEHKNFMKSLFHVRIPFVSDANFYKNDFSQESLFRLQSNAIRKAAETESCVFVGRCADYILRDFKNVFNVFVTADMDDRIKAVAERKGCPAEVARKIITNGENRRSSYYNFYTGKRWGYSESYDLCINTSRLGIDGTSQFIIQYIEKIIGK